MRFVVELVGLGAVGERGGRGPAAGDASALVYADGIDLDNPGTVTPVGVTCRLCERAACEQRALPSVKVPLRVDPNYRGVSLYAPPRAEGR